MVLRALQGALSFLTRLPVGGDDRAWEAFRRTPVALVLAGYVVGVLVAFPLALPLPVNTRAAVYVVTVYLLTGVTHADGLADVGDAAAVHGGSPDDGGEDGSATPRERRLAVLSAPDVGAGGVLALGVTLVVLGLGALGLAGLRPVDALALAVAAEVGAKTGMALLVCRGDPAHPGLGSALVDEASTADLLPVALALVPLAFLAPLTGTAGVAAALAGGPVAALVLGRWARGALGGVSGDVLGATNELGRAVGVHVGVVAWVLF